MKQVVPKVINKKTSQKTQTTQKKRNNKRKPFNKNNIRHKKYGTSQLEKDFAKNFLDKLGLVYIYQYEAKDIKRFYDFAITSYDDVVYNMEEKDGINCVQQEGQFFDVDLLIEVDGSFYHGDPRVVSENKITPMHKHNKFIDKIKDRWAGEHCIPLLRIWEYDIKKNPSKVIQEIKKYVKVNKQKRKIKENKKKPH